MVGDWRVEDRHPYVGAMGRPVSELTNEDLERLARLGGRTSQIAEAAGIDAAQVHRRLAKQPVPASDGRERPRL